MKTKNKLELKLDELAPVNSERLINSTFEIRVAYLIANKEKLIKDPNYQQALDTSYGCYWASLRGKENLYGETIINMYKNKELFGLGGVL